MHDKDHNQAPRYHIEKVDIDRDALKQLFKPFDEIKLARNNEPFLIVRAPYDPEVNAGLKGMRGRFMPTSKTWRVSIGQYQALLALAPKIHEIAAADWHDAINSVAREEANDKRILVKKEDLGFYLEGHLVGPVAVLCRPRCSFKPLFVRKRPGFSSRVLSGGVADCRSR